MLFVGGFSSQPLFREGLLEKPPRGRGEEDS